MTDDILCRVRNLFDDAFLQAEGDAIPSTESQLAAVEAQLGITAAQLADQKDKPFRLAAERRHFRKRSARERQEAEARGMSALVRGILDGFLDDLGQCFNNVDPATHASGRNILQQAPAQR